MASASLDRLKQIEQVLLGAAAAPSQHTVDSYLRRWRQWDQFAEHYEIEDLPADPVHVAAFALVRFEAGVSVSTISANLSAIRWLHGQYGYALSVTEMAKRTVAALGRHDTETNAVPVHAAPVLSYGALLRMAEFRPLEGRRFAVRLVRLVTEMRPAQLKSIRVDEVVFGDGLGWLEIPSPDGGRLRLDRRDHPRVCRTNGVSGLASSCPLSVLI